MLAPTITSTWTRRFVVYAERAGVDVPPLLAELGLPRSLVDDPHGRVPFAQHRALVTALADTLDDPGLGCDVARDADAAAFGVVGLLAESCATLGEALRTIRRFNSVANEASLMDFRVERGRLVIQDGHLRDGRPMPPPIAEATIAYYATMLRHTLDTPEPLLEVWLAHGEHRGWRPARRDHFAAALRFNAPVNALVLRADMRDAPFTSARPGLEQHLVRLAAHLEGELTPASQPVERLRARVQRSLAHGGPEPLDRLARSLGTTERSLQRELRAAGSSYRDIVDSVRREAAHSLLTGSSLGLEVVAEHVGYSDARAFRRACARWFGTTPASYRIAHR